MLNLEFSGFLFGWKCSFSTNPLRIQVKRGKIQKHSETSLNLCLQIVKSTEPSNQNEPKVFFLEKVKRGNAVEASRHSTFATSHPWFRKKIRSFKETLSKSWLSGIERNTPNAKYLLHEN